MSDKRQKNQLADSGSVVRAQQMELAFAQEHRGEAPKGLSEGTERLRRSAGLKTPLPNS